MVSKRASSFSQRVWSSLRWLEVKGGDRSCRFSCLSVVSRLWSRGILLAGAKRLLLGVRCMGLVSTF